MQTIVDICLSKYKIFRKEHHCLIVNPANAQKNALVDIEKVEEMQNEVIRKFRDYYYTQTNNSISEEIAYNAIIDFLKNHDLDITLSKEDQSKLSFGKERTFNNDLEYIFYKFTLYIYNQDIKLFDYLCKISLANMVVSYLFFSYDNYKSESLKNCNIYLDTPIILSLIGANGDIYFKIYQNYIESLKNSGAKLRLFEHKYYEVQHILKSCQDWIESPDYKPEKANNACKFFRKNNYKEIDIQMMISSLRETLSDMSISIEVKPEIIPKYEISESELEENILFNYHIPKSELEMWKRRSIEADIKSIVSIYMLRGDSTPLHLRDVKYLCITTNKALVKSNMEYLKKNKGIIEVPAILTDTFIGTHLWINKPTKALEENRKRLLAQSYAAMNSSPEFDKKVVEQVKKLLRQGKIKKDDYKLVVEDLTYNQVLAEEFFNNPDHVSTETVLEGIEKIKDDITRPLKNDLRKEIQEKKQYKRRLYFNIFENSIKKAKWEMFCKYSLSLLEIIIIVFTLIVINSTWDKILVNGLIALLLLLNKYIFVNSNLVALFSKKFPLFKPKSNFRQAVKYYYREGKSMLDN